MLGLPVFLFPKGQTGLSIGEGVGLFPPDLLLAFPIRQGFLGIFYRLCGIFQGLLGILLSGLSGLDGIQSFQGSGYPLGNGSVVRKPVIQGSFCFPGLVSGLTGLFRQPRQQDFLGLEQYQRICGGLLGVLIPLIQGLNFIGLLNGSRQLGIPGHGFFFPGALFQLGLGLFQLRKAGQQEFSLLKAIPGTVPAAGSLVICLRRLSFLKFQLPAQFFQVRYQSFQIRGAELITSADTLLALGQFLPAGAEVRQHNPSGFGAAGHPDLVHLAPLFLSAAFQSIHNLQVLLRVEQFPEHFFFLVGVCPEQFHELSLGDHGYLHELILGQSHNLLQLGVGFLLVLGILAAVGEQQGHGFPFLFHAAAPEQGTQMPGGTADGVYRGIFPGGLPEGQLHKGLGFVVGILALQLRTVLFVTGGAGFPVESKDDGVKQGGLSRSGVAGDQKQILVGFCKVDGGLLGVGAEGLNGQGDGFHGASSSTSSTTSRSRSASSGSKSPRKD